MNKSIVASVTIFLAALVPHCAAEGTGSQTHWFGTCDRDQDCGAGASCLCGVCTHACDASRGCTEGSREAICVPASSRAQGAQCRHPGPAICLPSCASGCAATEQCIAGACVIEPGPELDASASAGGSGGGGSGDTGGSSTGGRSAGGTAGVSGASAQAGESGDGNVGGQGARGGASGAGGTGGNPSGLQACGTSTLDPLSDPLCGGGLPAVSGTVTAISRETVCMSMIPGYAITVQPPGMPATTVRLALGDLPQPFVVGDRLEILTSRPLFQWWLTQDVRKNGVTVVYTSYALDTALPAPLTLERGDGVCSSATDCAYETVQNVHAVAGGMSGDIPPNGHADVGDFRVFNIYAANGGPLGGSSCPTDVELNLFRIAVVRRTSIESDDGGTSVDGGTGR